MSPATLRGSLSCFYSSNSLTFTLAPNCFPHLLIPCSDTSVFMESCSYTS